MHLRRKSIKARDTYYLTAVCIPAARCAPRLQLSQRRQRALHFARVDRRRLPGGLLVCCVFLGRGGRVSSLSEGKRRKHDPWVPEDIADWRWGKVMRQICQTFAYKFPTGFQHGANMLPKFVSIKWFCQILTRKSLRFGTPLTAFTPEAKCSLPEPTCKFKSSTCPLNIHSCQKSKTANGTVDIRRRDRTGRRYFVEWLSLIQAKLVVLTTPMRK